MISFYKHNLKKNDNHINQILSGEYLTSGPVCLKVENIISKRFNKSHCILTNSWTNAVIAILRSLKLKKNDEVILPACTFVACANVVEMINAKVVFADVNNSTQLMDIDDVLKKITKKTKVIMPVHLFGNLFNTYELKKKIRKNIYIIEDSAHCFSGIINKRQIGYYSDFAVFSFYATKNITSGEGGAIITNLKDKASQIKSICNNGLSKSAFNRFTDRKYQHWDVKDIGFKANMSDINASFLAKQIKEYNKNYKLRKKIFDYYKKKIKKIPQLNIPLENKSQKRDYHLFPIRIKSSRDKFMKYLNINNIPTTVNYRSILDLTYYKKKYKKQYCKNSLIWGNESLSLPFHLKLKVKEIDYIIKKIEIFFKNK
jgi:dTDP-4-amino-4,6-dideoxygalactose transaminase